MSYKSHTSTTLLTAPSSIASLQRKIDELKGKKEKKGAMKRLKNEMREALKRLQEEISDDEEDDNEDADAPEQ